LLINLAIIAAAAVAAGILPQARWQRVLNKKRIGCDSAKDIALAVRLSEAEVHQLVMEYSQWRWQQEGVKTTSIFSNSFR